MRRSIVLSVAACLVACPIAGLMTDRARAAERPDIVVILADDLGYGDVGCNNPESKIPTPHIDRLAAEGMRFTDAHTSSAVCTPTRYALLTGRSAWRTRLTSGVLDGFSPPLIEPDRLTVAAFLRSQGYATACIGKWHLGLQWTRTDGRPETADRGAAPGVRVGDDIDFTKPFTGGPLALGFDRFFGISASLNMSPFCFLEGDRPLVLPTLPQPRIRDAMFAATDRGVRSPDFTNHAVLPRLAGEAVRWIEARAAEPGQPFFLYAPLTSPHLPVVTNQEYLGTSAAGGYGDFVVETDGFVGAILDTLDRTGLADDTLVLVTSDNGGLFHTWDPREADDVAHYRPSPRGASVRALGHQGNAHLRGTKADIWEGGHRVPLVVRWPGHTPPGSVSDQLVELTDCIATVADIVDAPLPPGAGPDAVSFLPALVAETPTQPMRTTAVHHSLSGVFAIRAGRWKLVPEHRGSGGFSAPKALDAAVEGGPPGQLYDLAADPSETRNVYAEHPDIVARLTAQLAAIRGAEDRTALTAAVVADDDTGGVATATTDEPDTGGTAAADRPNIIVFLVDDMGVMDTSVPFLTDAEGRPRRYPLNDFYHTPAMERLATRGTRFSTFYAMSVCSPTRIALLTGQNAARHRTTNWINWRQNNAGPLGPPDWNWRGLDGDDVTLPRLLRQAGYRTIHVGKGHFAPRDTPGENPLNLGFDVNVAGTCIGAPATYFGAQNFAFRGRGNAGNNTGNNAGKKPAARQPADNAVPGLEKYHGQEIFLTEALTREAKAEVSAAVEARKPFFLYLAHYAVHAPFDADPRFAPRYADSGKPPQAQAFATLIEGMDRSLGDILDHLDALGVASNTLVVFLGDNGSDAPLGHQHAWACAAPLRGKKGAHYEGGMRVPCIVAWAAADPASPWQRRLPVVAGAIQTQPANVCDIVPTILGLDGIADPPGHVLDGESLATLLAGRPDPAHDQTFLMHYPHAPHRSDYFTVWRDGDWKVIYHHLPSEASGGGHYQLFNLRDDPFEEHDLAASQPAELARMMRGLVAACEAHGAQYPLDPESRKPRPPIMPAAVPLPSGDGANLDDTGRPTVARVIEESERAAIDVDVCVYGGTSGGVVAAVQAARMGKRVVLVEPGRHLGGMTSGGLSAVDIGEPRSVGGIAREYFSTLVARYGKTLRWDQPFVGQGGPATGGAYSIEPHVAEQVFEALVREAGVAVLRDARLAAVRKDATRIVELTTDDGRTVRARMFLDTTYEGDLLAAAGVGYTVMREGNARYGETYNGIHYAEKYRPRVAHAMPGANGRVPGGQGVWDRDFPLDPYVVPGDPASGLLSLVSAGDPGTPGDPAPGVMAYCFRLCLSTADDRLPIEPPPDYDPKTYELVARFIAACLKNGDDMDLRWFSKHDPLPNEKWDFNTATFGGNLPGASWEWPEATHDRRAEIARDLEHYHRGLLHFLATDPRVPAKVRADMARFGLPRDEFTDRGGWPHQVYVREGRRMIGDLVLTEHHTFGREVAPRSIGLGSYGTDIHEIRRIVRDGVVIREGKVAGGRGGFGPYQIGYGAIVPKAGECVNLLATFALSASHSAFASIRMEPVFMVTSQSAATAACLAIDGAVGVQEVDYEALRVRLLADGQVLSWPPRARPPVETPSPAQSSWNGRRGLISSAGLAAAGAASGSAASPSSGSSSIACSSR